MSSRSFCLILITFVLLASSLARAAVLGNPGNGQHYSGIGVISGWACEAGEVTVSFNGGPLIPLAYGTERPDTRGACGHTATGFVSLYNWARLGDGQHTAVVYSDGVEFARSTFTVGTAGTEFIRGAQTLVTVRDFPSPGERQEFEWNQSTQHLEMVSPDRMVVTGTGKQSPGAALGNPTHGLNYSGVGVISGWKCTAGRLTARINQGAPIPLVYGNERPDTQSVCGHVLTGFVAIYNWARLGDGEHTLVVYDNGVEFARSTFTVGTTGTEFLRDTSALVTVGGLPSAGPPMEFEWNQNTQHLEMVGGDGPADVGGTAQQPVAVGVNTAVRGSLESSTDVDYFEITVTEAGTLRIEVTGVATVLELRDSNGRLVARSAAAGPRGQGSSSGMTFALALPAAASPPDALEEDVERAVYNLVIRGLEGGTGEYVTVVVLDPDEPAGFAPADQAAWGRLVVGNLMVNRDNPFENYFEFPSAGRFLYTSVDAQIQLSGTYSYRNTGPNTGTFTMFLRDIRGGGDRLFATLQLTFTSTTRFSAVEVGGNQLESRWQIVVQEPTALSFGTARIADQQYTQNTAISTLTLPVATGGTAPLTYRLSPALPAGLRFDAGTRRLTGTPTSTLTATVYTYTVTDANGATASLTFRLSVEGGLTEPAGFAPANQQEFHLGETTFFTTVTSGDTSYTRVVAYLDFYSYTRFFIHSAFIHSTEGPKEGREGTYHYTRTGPNTGRIVFDFDPGHGSDCTMDITFISRLHGTYQGCGYSGTWEDDTY